MMRSNKNIIILIDLLIVILIFGFVNYNKFGYIIPKDIYLLLFLIHLSYWIVISIYYNKFSLTLSLPFQAIVKTILWSATISLFAIVSTVALTELREISRQFILGITIIPMFLELFIIGIFQFIIPNPISQTIEKQRTPYNHTSLLVNNKLIVLGTFLLITIYFIMVKIKSGSFYIYPWSERILLLLFASWLISLILTKKYVVNISTNIYYRITPFVKSGIIMFLISAGIFYFFRTKLIPRFLLFGTILAFISCEIIIQIFYFYLNTEKGAGIDNLGITKKRKSDSIWNIREITNYNNDDSDKLHENINFNLAFSQISSFPNKEEVIAFIQDKLHNENIKQTSSTIISTTHINNIEILNNSSRKLLWNLHQVNDIRRLNQYLILCHKKILSEGFLVGYLLPLETTYTRLRNKMPKLIFSILYPIHFIVYRVIPKIPKINRLYFIITKGHNRSISKYELFGRLNFCGFEIIGDQYIEDRLYFVVKKVKTISHDNNPSYHPIVKLNRVGLNNNLITIHKFRTMYPYSEYLQKDIYEDNKLDSSGKFKNDPRITSWGKIFRKYWIDELPQLYDWIQGRLNLVGVRAISEHYFSLYPRDLQEYRTKFKPGIIPPYYADMPDNLDEIFTSEWNYLKQKEKAPIKTDIKYALLAINNIILKGARSN